MMTKIKMLCPFSKKACRECSLYRGRHHYLCLYPSYGGSLKDEVDERKKKALSIFREGFEKFELPERLIPSPKWLMLRDFAERRKE